MKPGCVRLVATDLALWTIGVTAEKHVSGVSMPKFKNVERN
jgi:hypothetical protein